MISVIGRATSTKMVRHMLGFLTGLAESADNKTSQASVMNEGRFPAWSEHFVELARRATNFELDARRQSEQHHAPLVLVQWSHDSCCVVASVKMQEQGVKAASDHAKLFQTLRSNLEVGDHEVAARLITPALLVLRSGLQVRLDAIQQIQGNVVALATESESSSRAVQMALKAGGCLQCTKCGVAGHSGRNMV